MTKQLITTEIDIPDGFEFVRLDYEPFVMCRVVLQPSWQPPSWMRPGWIVSHGCDIWYWCEAEPNDRWPCGCGHVCCIWKDGKPTVGDFVPPPCDDWRQSKRRIGGAE